MAFSGDQRPQLREELRPLAAQNGWAALRAVWNGTATPFALEWAHRSSGTGAPFDWNSHPGACVFMKVSRYWIQSKITALSQLSRVMRPSSLACAKSSASLPVLVKARVIYRSQTVSSRIYNFDPSTVFLSGGLASRAKYCFRRTRGIPSSTISIKRCHIA